MLFIESLLGTVVRRILGTMEVRRLQLIVPISDIVPLISTMELSAVLSVRPKMLTFDCLPMASPRPAKGMLKRTSFLSCLSSIFLLGLVSTREGIFSSSRGVDFVFLRDQVKLLDAAKVLFDPNGSSDAKSKAYFWAISLFLWLRSYPSMAAKSSTSCLKTFSSTRAS
jgi:hypothetical protein